MRGDLASNRPKNTQGAHERAQEPGGPWVGTDGARPRGKSHVGRPLDTQMSSLRQVEEKRGARRERRGATCPFSGALMFFFAVALPPWVKYRLGHSPVLVLRWPGWVLWDLFCSSTRELEPLLKCEVGSAG